MKTACTTIAILSLVAVSSASADHKDQGRYGDPSQLAHALHVTAHHLADEIEHHFPRAHVTKQNTYIVTALARSIERDVQSFHHDLGVRKDIRQLEHALGEVDQFLRKTIAKGHSESRHIRATLREADQLADQLERSLRRVKVNQHDHQPYRGGRFGGRPGHDDHDHGGGFARGGRDRHDDHGHAGRGGQHDDDHIVARPGGFQIHRGGLVFDIRLR